MSKTYSLRRSRRVYRIIYRAYKRKKKRLAQNQQHLFEKKLHSLWESLKAKDREQASNLAKELEGLIKSHLPKSFTDQTIDLIGALAFALIVAILIRQMWFEFYVIPTGSMRPTLKEQDYLVVSKTDFGINTPLRTEHFYFDPDLVKRGEIVVFSGENMDIRDVNTTYFYLIPGKKQYVKRLIGKPGDTLYFYGGLLYGIDSQGNEITDFQQPWFEKIEHIPFIHFEGKAITSNTPTNGIFSPVLLYQMNEPVAKLYVTPTGQFGGEVLQRKVGDFGDLWGVKNFAMGALLTKEEAIEQGFSPTVDAPLYLRIVHHPTLHPARLIKDEYSRLRPALSYSYSLLPISDVQAQNLFHHLYTSRFLVKNGIAYRYGVNPKDANPLYQPKVQDVPNGTYEFQDGNLYRIGFAGIALKQPPTHPLNHYSAERTSLFYNLGIEMDDHFLPKSKLSPFAPSRYVYFRNGDLYLMGHPIILKDDPILKELETNEMSKAENTSYAPFVDSRPPIKEDGSLDKDFIKKYGLKIPDKMYLMLGDNHAFSSDSRVFGFVPQGNIRGGPSFIFWPPSHRWGSLPQPSHPWVTFPNITIWSLFVIIVVVYAIYLRSRFKRPPKF